jgi:AcrR family transcriptional regulator
MLKAQKAVKKVERRRGDALEEAILGAAWAELFDRGYAGFTMEAVATRAGTSRPVLSRRWQTRADLAVAAIGCYMRKNPISIPDVGNTRDELVMYLQKLSDRGMIAVAKVLFSMRDYFVETDSTLADLRNKLGNLRADNQSIGDIIQRGVKRGEIDPNKLTKRIASLPLDLVRHEGLMTQKPIPRAVIADIIDSIFLPLVSAKKTTRRSL